jgi:hypothetical protein
LTNKNLKGVGEIHQGKRFRGGGGVQHPAPISELIRLCLI